MLSSIAFWEQNPGTNHKQFDDEKNPHIKLYGVTETKINKQQSLLSVRGGMACMFGIVTTLCDMLDNITT